MNQIHVLFNNIDLKNKLSLSIDMYDTIYLDDFIKTQDLILENKVKLLIIEDLFFNDLLTLYNNYLSKLEFLFIPCIIISTKGNEYFNINDLINLSVINVIDYNISHNQLLLAINNALKLHKLKNDNKKLSYDNRKHLAALNTLSELGRLLSTELNLDSLLSTILYKMRELTNSDSGSISIIEGGAPLTKSERDFARMYENSLERHLVFKEVQISSVPNSYDTMRVPISRKSLSGYVALEATPLTIVDAYHIPENAEYSFFPEVDRLSGYRTKSMLILPLINHQEELLGVISLINRKKDFNIPIVNVEEDVEKHVISYEPDLVNTALAIANQAAIAIENVQLINSIQHLFEGFVFASIKAIEQRDPTTSGHSERVALISILIAKAISRTNKGIYKDTVFSNEQMTELKYAALLHDFGKVGVRENVLTKANKLYEWEMTIIEERVKYIKECIANKFLLQKIETILENNQTEINDSLKIIENSMKQELEVLEKNYDFIRKSYKPIPIKEDDIRQLETIYQQNYSDYYNNQVNLLTSVEKSKLCTQFGSLTLEERKEIESHVIHTYDFLSAIPWLNTLKQIPEIAFCHHERLNGKGYPRNKILSDIPLQSRIIMIADIYDALTANDRPYKHAASKERAIEILRQEAEQNSIDMDIVEIFVDNKIYDSLD